jgi:hypothetical protein
MAMMLVEAGKAFRCGDRGQQVFATEADVSDPPSK